MLLQEILRPYGVKDHRDLGKAIGFHPEHARKFWAGRMPLSIRAAEGLKKFTNGHYTLDFLLSINRKPKGRRQRGKAVCPTARS